MQLISPAPLPETQHIPVNNLKNPRIPLTVLTVERTLAYLLKMTSVYFLNITVLTDFEGIAERTETGSQLRFGSV